MDSTKSLDELRRELDELKAINEQEKRNLEREERELREAQGRLAMRQHEKRQLDGQFTDLLARMMMNSDAGLAQIVLNGIAQVEDELKNPDSDVAAKDKEITELDKEFNETLDKLSGGEIDEILRRAQTEDAALKELVREKEAELQRLKNTKANNRKEIAHRKKERRQKINNLTEKYNGLHAQLMKKKYGGGESPASQAFDDGSDD